MEQAATLPTASALRLSGVAASHWSAALVRRLYTEAPKVVDRQRKFSADDLIALQFFGELIRTGVVVNRAAPLANELRTVLRTTPTVKKLYVAIVAKTDGTECSAILHAPGQSTILMVLDVAGWRRVALAAIAAESS